ncbi:unnamed protein product [Pedinophyceae sp. YPF-701]|nr:unnamed protein product [Pedinophyceae sp. YPF-701]
MSDRRSGKAPKDMSPKEQVRESLAQAARLQGRDAGTKGVQVVMGDEDDMDKWKELDARVNEYPAWRNFKAIGEGGDDFRDSVVALVGAALGESVGEDCVRVRPSSGGKYVAVDVGPVLVKKPEDVVAVFTELRKEPRIRWWM